MPLPDKTHKVIILTTAALAAICTSAFAQQDSLYDENQTARLEIIDAALASAEVEFFKQPPAPAFVAQEPPPKTFSSTDENSFGYTEQQARELAEETNQKTHL